MPHNVKAVYSADHYSCGSHDGGLSTVTVNEYKGIPRIVKDKSHIIRTFEDKISNAETQLEQENKELHRLRSHMEDIISKRDNLKLRMPGKKLEIAKTAEQIKNLQQEMNEEDPASVTQYEEWREDNIEKLEAYKKQKMSISSSLAAAESRYNAILRNSRQIAKELEVLKNEKQNLQNQFEEFSKDTEIAEKSYRHYKLKSSEHKKAYEELLEEVNGLKSGIGELIENSEFERINVTMSIDNIERELKRLTARIQEKEKE